MIFTRRIQDIRNLPITISNWALAQVGRKNNGPYKDLYPKLDIVDTGNEKLVDVSQYGIASSDYYLDKYINGETSFEGCFKNGLLYPRAFLRQNHASRLALVDTFLRSNGLFLYVRSGWRHREVQETAKKAASRELGQEASERLFAPSSSCPPPHSTGAAMDLEIWSMSDGRSLSLSVSIENMNIHGLYDLELIIQEDKHIKTNDIAHEALKNRRLLHHVMCTVGVVFDQEADLFVAHPGEYWHFGDGDQLSEFLSGKSVARCREMRAEERVSNVSEARVAQGGS